MRGALPEYLRLMWRHWWQLVIGVAAGIAGLLTDMEAIPEPLPSWVWWGLAVATFAIAQFMSFLTLHKEVAKFRAKPKADTSLHVVFDRLHERATLTHMHNDAIELAINSIVEKAAAGDIVIFGSTVDPKNGNGPIMEIPSEYWRENSITIYGNKAYFTFPESIRETQIRTTGESDLYYALKTDGAQVELCWAQEKRFKLRWPVWRETVDVAR